MSAHPTDGGPAFPVRCEHLASMLATRPEGGVVRTYLDPVGTRECCKECLDAGFLTARKPQASEYLGRIIATDSHRNGIAGKGFDVTIAEGGGELTGRRFLLIDFGRDTDKAIGNVCVAAVDLDLAASGEVRFAHNSWRGDQFAAELRPMVERWNLNQQAAREAKR